MKKHLSLLLVCILLFGITASAGTTSYYMQDFSTYETTTDMFTDVASMTQTVLANSTVTSIASLTPGKMNTANGATQFILKTNASGQKYPSFNVAGVSIGFYYISENVWTANANESYVISFNLESASDDTYEPYNYIGVVAKNANGTYSAAQIASVYRKGRLGTCYNGAAGYLTTGSVGSNHGDYDYLNGVTKRFAIKFDLNTTGIKRSGYSTNDQNVYSCWYADSVFNLDSFTNVAGLTVHMRNNLPDLSDIRMYAINNQVAFKASAETEGLVPPSTKTLKIKFSRPIVHSTFDKNAVTITNKTTDTPFTSFTVGDIKDVVSGNKIYSTVDINFTTALAEENEFEVTVPSTVKDEIATIIGSTNNKFTFTTDDHPVFTASVSADGLGDADLDTKLNQNVTFTSEFTNTEAVSIDTVIFLGLFNSLDQLMGYNFVETTIAAGASQNLSFTNKITENGMYVKAISLGTLTDLAGGPDFSSASTGTNIVD